MSRSGNRSRSHFGFPYDWTGEDREVQDVLRLPSGDAKTPKRSGPAWFRSVAAPHIKDFLGDLVTAGKVAPELDWSKLHVSRDTAGYQNIDALTIDQTITHLEHRLSDQIRSLLDSGISPTGGVLYYSDRLDRCVIFEYRLSQHQSALKLAPCAEVRQPDFLYDIDAALATSSPETRAALKSAVIFGHKIVAHRNTIVHVDRRRDVGTVGPFIDTILINEILHRYVYEFFRTQHSQELYKFIPKRVLEIGSGNGMLITSAAKNLTGVEQFIAIDPHMNSIHCTHRNFVANNPNQHLISICGRFGSIHIGSVDLAICNPPYIPIPPDFELRDEISAIGGTGLLELVVKESQNFLSRDGVLIMIFSTLANVEFEAAVKDSQAAYIDLAPPTGFRVTFDLPEVMANRKWQDFLVNERRLEELHGQIHHALRCVAVYRREIDATMHPLIARMTQLASQLR